MARDQRGEIRGATGKLTAAARHWLDGGESRDDTDKALAAFGLVIESAPSPSGGGLGWGTPFKVFANNWPTLTIFWATWNQWQRIVNGSNITRVGIDWVQVEAALKLSGIKRAEWPMIFDGLRAIEVDALEWLNRE